MFSVFFWGGGKINIIHYEKVLALFFAGIALLFASGCEKRDDGLSKKVYETEDSVKGWYVLSSVLPSSKNEACYNLNGDKTSSYDILSELEIMPGFDKNSYRAYVGKVDPNFYSGHIQLHFPVQGVEYCENGTPMGSTMFCELANTETDYIISHKGNNFIYTYPITDFIRGWKDAPFYVKALSNGKVSFPKSDVLVFETDTEVYDFDKECLLNVHLIYTFNRVTKEEHID